MLHPGQQLFLHRQGVPDASLNGLFIKVGIGDGREQVQGDEMVDLPLHRLPLGTKSRGHGRQAFRYIDQQILHRSYIRLLAAHAYTGTAGASSSLLALITKHLGLHK